ncbi:ABC transporter permease, partial [Pseudorhodoplanes sp.]|uniref:ABC transporter permease n=1 Tax=Pseudorhodoplanes sp. TaxID=1934341 RepID=UPI003D0B38AE
MLLMPLALLYAVMLGVPLIYVISDALNTTGSGATPFFSTVSNPTYLGVLLRTFEISTVSTVVCLILGFPLAFALWRATPLVRTLLLVAVLFPYWTSVVVRAFGWQVMLKRNGFISTLLQSSGLVSSDIQLSNSRLGLYLGLVQILLPSLVLPVLATLSRLDSRLLEAAYTNGAQPVTAIRTVIVPLAMPGIVIGCLIVFAVAAGSFVIPVLLGGLGDTMLAQVIAYQTAEMLNWPVAMALSLLLILMTLIVLMLISAVGRRQAIYR